MQVSTRARIRRQRSRRRHCRIWRTRGRRSLPPSVLHDVGRDSPIVLAAVGLLDHFHPEVVEVGFGIASQAERDCEGPGCGRLPEKNDARERRNRTICPELKLFAANRIAHDNSAQSARTRIRSFHQNGNPNQVIGFDRNGWRPDGRNGKVEELGQDCIELVLLLGGRPEA